MSFDNSFIVNSKRIDYSALKQAEKLLVDTILIPDYFKSFVVKNFSKYQVRGVNTDLLAGPVLCPFHAEREPSFYYEPVKKFYNCFSCGSKGVGHSGGNIVHLNKEILKVLYKRDVSISESIKFLATLYDVLIPVFEYTEEKTDYVKGVTDILSSKKEYALNDSTNKYVCVKNLMDLHKDATLKQHILLDNTYSLLKSGVKILKSDFETLYKSL